MSESFTDRIAKYAINAASAYAASKMVFSAPGRVGLITVDKILPSGQYSLAMVQAAASVGASLVSDGLHSFVLPHIAHNNKLSNKEALVLAALASGGAFTVVQEVLSEGSTQELGRAKVFAVGAASEMLGHYVYESTIHPPM